MNASDCKLPPHFALWCPFGAGFDTFTGVDLEATEWSRLHAKSVFGRLQSENQLLFTPCGGHDQASDNVISYLAKIISNSKTVVVVSGDMGLLENIPKETKRSVNAGYTVACHPNKPFAAIW